MLFIPKPYDSVSTQQSASKVVNTYLLAGIVI